MLVSVSFTKYKNSIKETISAINETNADFLHIDLMDGKFVPEKQQLPSELSKILSYNKKPLDVHLMADNPHKYLDFFASYNTEYLTFHLEAVKDPIDIINLIHSYGIKCGISIKPETDVKDLLPYLDMIEQVLIMSVEPGKGGQSFMLSAVDKINYLKEMPNKQFIVSIDGGINSETTVHIQNADMLVSGSFICLADNFQASINVLKSIN